jgi:hypothetical protein
MRQSYTVLKEILLKKASLLQWRGLLAQCEREAFIIQRLLAIKYHPGC